MAPLDVGIAWVAEPAGRHDPAGGVTIPSGSAAATRAASTPAMAKVNGRLDEELRGSAGVMPCGAVRCGAPDPPQRSTAAQQGERTREAIGELKLVLALLVSWYSLVHRGAPRLVGSLCKSSISRRSLIV